MASVFLPLVACASVPSPGSSTWVRSVPTENYRAVSVVEDNRFEDHEPAQVSAGALARALLSSGLFGDEDATQLAGPIAAELARMEPREFIRITTWADDGARLYYLYLHGGQVRVHYFRGTNELEHVEMAIVTPAKGVAITAHAPDVVRTASPIDAGVTATALADASTPAPAPTSPEAAAKIAAPSRPRSRRAPPPRLTEDEARRKLGDLDRMLRAGLIRNDEYRAKRKEILERL